ncbi:MAG: hypothetical protein QOE68_2492 [Thermoanaerobaculia bacterium]|nr:hypothetical protein [Thermoanaerobaculia bacterium]
MGNVIDMEDKDAVYAALDGVPLPRIPLNDDGLGDATIAENADELLDSFGAEVDGGIER